MVAAAIPLAFGALTVFAGRGVLALLSEAMTIDALALVVCTMMGLALGVDYSLLIVSRFREELERGQDPWEAAAVTRGSAGRTTLFAGVTLIVALVVSAFLQPGSLLLSLATATAVVTVISVVVSALAVPPLLACSARGSTPAGSAAAAPGAAPIVAAAAAAALRNPALPPPGRGAAGPADPADPRLHHRRPRHRRAAGLQPGPRERRSDRRARSAPAGRRRSSSSPRPSAARSPTATICALLARWQRRIAAEPGVRAVIGPGPIARRAAPLRALGTGWPPGDRRTGELERLGPACAAPPRAVEQLRAGIAEGAEGSGLLAEGSERAAAGAGLIAAELGRAAGRGEEATAAIGRLGTAASDSPRASARPRSAASPWPWPALAAAADARRRAGARAQLARQLEGAAAADPALRRPPNRPASWPARSPPTATKCGGCATSPRRSTAASTGWSRAARSSKTGSGSSPKRPAGSAAAWSGSAAAPNDSRPG